MRFWINKYEPLAASKGGMDAAGRSGEPPFVDGSHRREPYLSEELATISSICRGSNFAPRLNTGDIVVYLTKKRRYGDDAETSMRLTAVLEVVRKFDSHEDAAAWLIGEGRTPPSNCLVEGNDDLDAEACAPCSPGKRRDLETCYRSRVEQYPVYFICDPLWLCLESPPTVTDAILESALGRVPMVQTPTTWTRREVRALLRKVGLGHVRLPGR